MDDSNQPGILVRRLHSLAVQRGMTIKDMAQKCGIPKSSLEGYMRRQDAKRPGIDALISIAIAMEVSIDWLCGLTDRQRLNEDDRKTLALGMFRMVLEVLRDIEAAQANSPVPLVKDGKIGGEDFDQFAVKVMLHFQGKEDLFPAADFDSLKILNTVLDEAVNSK